MAAPALKIAAQAPAVSGWAVLAIGSVRLALPQREVRQIDLVSDLKESAAGEGPQIGWLIRKDGESWPAYCLDENLALQRPAPAHRHLCVFFRSQRGVHGILCDHVWSLAADTDVRPMPLPGCMGGPRSPAVGLARFEDGVALVTGGAALGSYLIDRVEVERGRPG